MVQIVLSSSSLPINTESYESPSIIQTGANYIVPYDYYDMIYGKAVYSIPTISFPGPQGVTRRMRLKTFKGTYFQMTTEKKYNNNLILHNVTDNTTTVYQFEPKIFDSVTDYVTYLNLTCLDLTFAYNDPNTNPEVYGIAAGKCVITHNDPTKEWYLYFDSRSINRSLGFDLGKTPNVPPGSSLVSNTSFTLSSIGRIYMSLQVGTKSFTNARSFLSYIVYVEGINLENTPAKSLSFNENNQFQQYIDINTSQFNQIVVSLYDEFNNIVYLHGHYNFVLEIEE